MDAKATKLPAHDKFYIGGEWVDPAPGYQTQQVINPSTEEVVATIPLGSAAGSRGQGGTKRLRRLVAERPESPL